MFKLKNNPPNKPKITIPKKDRPLVIILALWYFMLGPFQTIGMLISSDMEFMDALYNGIQRRDEFGVTRTHSIVWHLVDNSVGSFGLWALSYLAVRLYRSGEISRALLRIVGVGLRIVFGKPKQHEQVLWLLDK